LKDFFCYKKQLLHIGKHENKLIKINHLSEYKENMKKRKRKKKETKQRKLKFMSVFFFVRVVLFRNFTSNQLLKPNIEIIYIVLIFFYDIYNVLIFFLAVILY
jgi:hypothetical protein